MSVHYLIDGYNVLNQIPHIASKKSKDARGELIRLIKKYRLTGSPRNEVSIVFDGRRDVFAPCMEKEFRIIFTIDGSADDKIKKIIASSPNPARVILVTNDKELIFFARNYRAGVYSVNEFLGKILKFKNIKTGKEEKIKLEFSTARKITEELKGLWLKNNENK